jgi:tetratricopeptide (TPR) repeat protein
MKIISAYVMTILLLTGCVSSVWGAAKGADLDSLYTQIDEAISRSPQYVAERNRQINNAMEKFIAAHDAQQRLESAEALFMLYKPYKNDSALNYAEVCIDLSDSLHLLGEAGRYRSLQAHQYSNAGLYVEAIDRLRQVNPSVLDNRGLTAYYEAWMHVYGQLGQFTQLRHLQRAYFDRQDHYRDSVLMVASEGSEEYLHLKMDVLCARMQYQEALSVSDRWCASVADGTHENAYACFYRSVVYGKLGNNSLLRYWLGKSALDDIKCAVMNQASLLFLAEHLANDGDIDRALRYVEFAKACNLAFSPQMRAYQVNSVVNVIEKSSQVSRDQTRIILVFASVIIFLLLMALIYTIVFYRRRR